jgi:hypothetical protein
MRLQLQRNDQLRPDKPRYTGMLNAMSTIVKQERWYSLWKVNICVFSQAWNAERGPNPVLIT